MRRDHSFFSTRLRAWAAVLGMAVATAACEGGTDPSIRLVIDGVTATEFSGIAGSVVEPPPTVRVTDENGEPVAGVTVVFSLGPGGGSVEFPTVKTGADGLASDAWTLGPRVGRLALAARVEGGGRVAFIAMAGAGPIAGISPVGGGDQTGPTGAPLAQHLRVRVTDREPDEDEEVFSGNPISGAVVTFTVLSGGGSIEGASAVTDSAGVAESGPWTLGSEPVTQRVLVESGSVQAVLEASAVEDGIESRPPPPCSAAPDCGRVAFVSERDGNPEIYSVNPDGTGLVRLTNDAAADMSPAWSPDGRRIAFISTRGGDKDVFVMDADGSNVVRRTVAAAYASEPAWSPDGTRIVYSDVGPRGEDLWVVSADEDGSPTLLFTELGWADQPAWSPDGARLALMSNRDTNDFDVIQDIYVIKADGSDLEPLTGDLWDRIDYAYPSWSPDGLKIAVSIHKDVRPVGVGYVGVMDTDGGGLTRLSSSAAWSETSWSRDGELITFTTMAGEARNVSWVRADGSAGGTMVLDGWSADWGR